MLNAVKHLYHIVDLKERVRQRMRNNVVAITRCVQHELRLSLMWGFRYAALLSCLLLASTSQAQTYPIKTLDGINTTIKIRTRTTATPFTISSSTDKLILPNYWAGGKIKVLNKKFLEIKYYIRGGSGVGRGNTLLLCISHGKLRQVLHINSYTYDMGDEEITATYMRLLLDAANTAHITTYDTLTYRQSSQLSSTTIKNSNIKFDITQRVFYNYQKKVNTTLDSFNYKTNHSNKRHFIGIVPAFQLNGCEYVFINSQWYGKDKSDEMYSLID